MTTHDAIPHPILIVGSVAIDQVIDLEAPIRAGSHNAASDRGERIGGGAANTAMAMARAGDPVAVISAVGQDAAGIRLLANLRSLGVDVDLVDRHAGQGTRSLVLLDPSGERTIVNLSRCAVPLPADLGERPASAFYVRSADPLLTVVLRQIVYRCPVLAHVPPVRDNFRPAQVLVGSESDLDAAFLADPFAAARRIAGDHLKWMVVTRGAAGASAHGAESVLHRPAPPVARVIDSTGAGDAFAGGLLHGLARRWDMARCLETAVAWGSASVAYEGTMPPEGAFPGS